MWDDHLPSKYVDEAPKLVTKDDGTDVWAFQGAELPNIGLNAVAGRPPAEYGIDPTAFADMRRRLLRHPRARPRHERQRRARVDVLPVDARLLRAAVGARRGQGSREGAAPGLQRLAHRRVVRRVPGSLHPAVVAGAVGPERDGRRDPPRRGEGLPRGHVLGEPGEARLPELPLRALGSVLARRAATKARSSACTSARRRSS